MLSKIVHDLNQGTLRQFDIGIQNEVIVSQHRIKHRIVPCAIAIVGLPGQYNEAEASYQKGLYEASLERPENTLPTDSDLLNIRVGEPPRAQRPCPDSLSLLATE